MIRCGNCAEENPERARFCLACGAPLAPSTTDRRLVTALFCDLVGSTQLGERLDPEVLRRVLDRYHASMQEAIERHGGTVEKFIGDAVVGVFGIPATHEDDALRAARAALEMRDALPALRAELELDLDVRIGLQSGEAVADLTTAIQGRVAADVFNTSARLQSAAAPGSILVGEETAKLLGNAAELAPVEPLQLKGKEAGVPAFELRGVGPGRTTADRPLVGRERQLAALRLGLEDAIEADAPMLVTILAPPGVGKSRLGRAFIEAIEGSATVLVGQTPAYGEGVTFAPLVEMLAVASGDRFGTSAAVADRLRARMAGVSDGAAVADRLAQLLGVGEASGADTAWAVRRLLETIAAERPLVIVLDDAHAAEEAMLDLLEAVLDRLHAAALVVCLARPDLLEARPTWGGGRPRAITATLPPLTDEESRALATSLLGVAAPDSIVDAVCDRSEGNPLYLEQLSAELEDRGSIEGGRWLGTADEELEVPPTIHALLGARLDRLGNDDRQLLEVASVEGRRFRLDALRSLLPDRPEIRGTLDELERRGFVAPEDATGSGWRFGHALIREAAYRRLSKERRSELHVALADWIDRDRAGHPDADEAVGRHLETALGYRQELRLEGAGSEALATRAGERFAAAGQRALARLDLTSSAGLLQRAANLLPAASPERLELLPQLGVALMEIGRAHDADALLADAIDTARSAGAEADALRAEIQLISARAVYESSNDSEVERNLDSVERARDALGRLHHEAGLAEAWVTIEYLEWMRGRTDRMYLAAREGFRHGVSSGRARDAMQAGGDMVWSAVAGSMPFDQIRAMGESLSGARDPIPRAVSLSALAVADLAESSDAFDERERERTSVIEQHGLDWLGAVQGLSLAYLEYQLGLHERMERRLLDARDTLAASNDVWWLNSATPLLGLAVWGQGRTREFLRIADAYDADIQVFDRDARVRRYLLRALASLARGALPEAERAGRTALELVEPTDLATTKTDVLTALAEIAEVRGFPEQASAQRDRVTEIHRSRGNVAALTALRQAASASASRNPAG